MSKFNVKVDSVSPELLVQGTCDGVPFEASPFRWGSKMLMKVVSDEVRGGLTQGAKVAIGAAAKKAIRTAGMEIPKAELVRPRKPKSENTETVVAEVEVPVTETDVTDAE